MEHGLAVSEELIPPSVPPRYAAGVLKMYRQQKIGSGRALELLRGTLTEEELPITDEIPLAGLRGELEPAL